MSKLIKLVIIIGVLFIGRLPMNAVTHKINLDKLSLTEFIIEFNRLRSEAFTIILYEDYNGH